MRYILIIGYLYLVFSILVNVSANIKNKNKVFYLNIIGLVIVIILLIRHLLNL
jgi:Na+-transporting NADH:ubiquinone oxidoreductase subunit NqrB